MSEIKFDRERSQNLVDFLIGLISKNIREASLYKEGILIYDSSLEFFPTGLGDIQNYTVRFYPTDIKIDHKLKEATIMGENVGRTSYRQLSRNRRTYKLGYEWTEDRKVFIRFFKVHDSQFVDHRTPLVA